MFDAVVFSFKISVTKSSPELMSSGIAGTVAFAV